MDNSVTIHFLGLQPYIEVWDAMKAFSIQRATETKEDEIWFVEHFPVYTQGQAGKAHHIKCLTTSHHQAIPIVHTDRGGQVTYHGPGQLVIYPLFDLRKRELGIKTFVCQLEQLIISLLAEFKIHAHTECGAPGVYVDRKKIASIGLRVKNGCTYHGIALNISMDLTPFSGINPCGYTDLTMTQMSDFLPEITVEDITTVLHDLCLTTFG